MNFLKQLLLLTGLIIIPPTLLNAQLIPYKPAVIAYYAGSATLIDSFDISSLSHIIFSFGHLKEKQLHISNARDTLTIQHLVAQKTRNPALKVMLSLGGWGDCKDCSEVFSTKKGRRIFSRSVKELLGYFKADGIDLDWEYPAIAGYPGHAYALTDKANFTSLIRKLRKKLGNKALISFAAGGFTSFLNQSIEWTSVIPKIDFVNLMTYDLVNGASVVTFLNQSIEWTSVIPKIDFVNLMTYDLVNGASVVTGHHTPLYSTPDQKESGDNAINYLIAAGIPANKLVMGAAFYGRLFDSVQNINNGLYQPGHFISYLPGRLIADRTSEQEGFVYYWDDIAKAPYYYNAATQTFLTFENGESLAFKTRYVIEKKLFGIMFWQLTEDKLQDGLLKAISEALIPAY